ncbi:unnamed protein product [Lampetra planeri]
MTEVYSSSISSSPQIGAEGEARFPSTPRGRERSSWGVWILRPLSCIRPEKHHGTEATAARLKAEDRRDKQLEPNRNQIFITNRSYIFISAGQEVHEVHEDGGGEEDERVRVPGEEQRQVRER